jgi:hypothetical protein
MLTSRCLVCGEKKEDLAATKCPECTKTENAVMDEARKNGWDYWETHKALQNEISARRTQIGMRGKNDPRMWNEPVDYSKVRERLGQ